MSTQPHVARAEPVHISLSRIQELIQHRPPKLFLDSAIVYHDELIEGHLRITERHCQGHFPGNPLFPGSDMYEMANQVAGILMGHRCGMPVIGVAAGIRRLKFEGEVRPGSLLRMKVIPQRQKLHFLFFSAEGWVGDDVVFTSEQQVREITSYSLPAG